MSKAEALERERAGEIFRFDQAGKKFMLAGPVRVTQALRMTEAIRSMRPAVISANDMRVAIERGSQGEAARTKIENYGARVLALEGVTFDTEDVWFRTPRGEPVLALIKHRNAEVAEMARDYLARRWPSGRGTLLQFGDAMRARQGVIRASELLNKFWRDVALQFWAGDFSDLVNGARADRLPGLLVFRTIQAYLHERGTNNEQNFGRPHPR